MTKLTWDNAALIGPSTARELGVWQGDVIAIEAAGQSIEAPVYVMPGQALDTIGLAMGYGRETGSEEVVGKGVNAQRVRPPSGALMMAGATVRKTGRTYELATTQNHFALDAMGREGIEQRRSDLVRETTLEAYKHDPEHAAGHKHKLFGLFSPHQYDGHRWAMAIDLSACTGCTACVVACQAENNVPVVGKTRIQRGREMHWIRIDRYFAGSDDAPAVVNAPVTCMHCEDAPCEQVCPVAATVHDSEGLNVMVYNRCVGTRYCSNNCPYKVRRFNFFNYRKKLTDLEALQLNPEVTVRSRGVMEKCTFCTQRIETARIDAKVAGRALKDGDIVTACEQTCPTNAIVFGDLNDEKSRVRKLHDGHRAYPMLEYLNVKPRVEYLVKVRNPLPALAPAGSAADHKEHA
ncbi:MAG: 4Fe-4S dicluster domain-containing protein [Acidobacteria bacterium]|nr:4Fe-4S dicluster domain-containing protein [Acidobacteriota bacterium]